MENFYKTLYSSQISEDNFNDSAPLFLNCNNIKRLDGEQQKTCEGLITEEECLSAVKQFSKNKTPGSDGLTGEFYLCYAYQRGEMSISQRRGVISLLPKKNKAARVSLAIVNRQRSNRLCQKSRYWGKYSVDF